MRAIVVFRHGVPDEEENLSEKYGRPGVEKLGKSILRIAQGRSCILYSSPVPRAFQTAAVVSAQIGGLPIHKANCLVYLDDERRKELSELVEEAWKSYEIVILSTHHPVTNSVTEMFFEGKHKGALPSPERSHVGKEFSYGEGLFLSDDFLMRFPS